MYIHVGENIMVRADEMIVMLAKETVQASEQMQKLLEEKEEQIIDIANGPYKSIVFTESDIYLSPIATSTLKRQITELNNHALFI
ncbi:extracellular matrix regulator RemB [Bacillus sp. FJAT-50079]|uniref:extracellular matrix regulator RemB n=1 Tax=Bacillus sp. FJAT-50079 TaxID=2833577 RepID=UPI001BC8D7D8|nr:extracellular matrix/biofilm biosynthesis regulator RemA family protein [Bacillus sp. FJAT-50079]MBS4207177.1 DUF370 domain-containing protein [Bacillus sp. FJAT-50079]